MSAIKNNEADPRFNVNNKIDIRANTICAGANWRLLSNSGQCCDLYGFQRNFKNVEDGPIEIVSTVIRDEHG